MPRVQVLVRCRPALPHEAGKPCSKVETNEVSNTVRVVASQTNARVFTFDRVLPETAQQEDVFENVLPMIDHALDGLHATIFAYGQTGSGKTHTMEGIDYVKDAGTGKLRPNPKTPPQQHGIIPRVIEALFERARLRMGANPHLQYRIAVSFMQIYNERVSDLLNPGVLKDGLKIRWTRSKFEVENLFHLECDSADQTRELFFMGVRNKMMSSHAMNQQSSRSHCLFTIHVSSYDPSDRDAVTKSELTLVDLAGSEKLAMLAEDPSDKLVRESIEINASLLALGKVITALASKVKSHVPYRDAKLTKLLQHSLGGNSMTTMIACISPLDAYVDESMSTLMYAGRARNIHNDPVVNEDPRTALIRQLRQEIVTLKEQIAQLQTMAAAGLTDFQQLSQQPGKAAGAAAPERGGGGGSGGAESDADAKQLADKLIASCEMLKHVIDTNTQLRGAFDALHTLKQEADQREYELQAENIALRERIELLESIVLADANTTTSGTEDGARPRSNNLLRSLDAAAAAPDPPMYTTTSAPADASRSRGAAVTGPSRSDPSPVRPVQPSSRDQQQQQKLNAYSKKYRDPRGTSSYSDYYGLAKKATEPSRNRQSQIVAEVESLITKAGPATAAMVPLSLQSTGNYGSLAFGGAREDVEELEERRRRRAEKRAALEEQHRRMQQGLSPAEMFSATATSATPAHSVAVPARPSSQHATRRAPTDQLFDYLSTSESASVFTSEQLQRLRERRGVGGSIPPPARKPGAAGGAASDMAPTLRREAQSNADYRRELMQAQNLVLSLNRGASH